MSVELEKAKKLFSFIAGTNDIKEVALFKEQLLEARKNLNEEDALELVKYFINLRFSEAEEQFRNALINSYQNGNKK